MTLPDRLSPLVIINTTVSTLEVWVELHPDRYLIKPNDEMTIEADPSGAPFTIQPFEGGLQVFPGNTAGALVTINGIPVEPDHITPAQPKAETLSDMGKS